MRGSAFRRFGALALALVIVWEPAPSRAQPPAPPPPPPPPSDRDAPIECEFRIFDGEDEVTADTTLRLFPTGTRADGIPVGPINGHLLIHVAPAVYDAQVVRVDQGHVSNIRWSERLPLMREPDDQGRHLEVLNFRARYGALRVVSRRRRDFELIAMRPGARDGSNPVGRIVKGEGYLLLVAPAGRYDIRIRSGTAADTEERWLLDLELAADRTRLRTSESN